MPYFVEGLGDIQEGSGAILSFFKRFQDGVGYGAELADFLCGSVLNT
jgi:hypothetical protein